MTSLEKDPKPVLEKDLNMPLIHQVNMVSWPKIGAAKAVMRLY